MNDWNGTIGRTGVQSRHGKTIVSTWIKVAEKIPLHRIEGDPLELTLIGHADSVGILADGEIFASGRCRLEPGTYLAGMGLCDVEEVDGRMVAGRLCYVTVHPAGTDEEQASWPGCTIEVSA